MTKKILLGLVLALSAALLTVKVAMATGNENSNLNNNSNQNNDTESRKCGKNTTWGCIKSIYGGDNNKNSG